MIYSALIIKWLALTAADLCLQIAALFVTPVLSLFTSDGWPKWGSLFWTYDNPPQGDNGWQTKRAPYIPANTRWRLYVNRVMWLYRNPTYGFAKNVSVSYNKSQLIRIIISGGHGLDISDKYGRSGYYLAVCENGVLPSAFEFYLVCQWSESKCLRVRIGWKIVTDKFAKIGFAPLVHMINPVKSYGV